MYLSLNTFRCLILTFRSENLNIRYNISVQDLSVEIQLESHQSQAQNNPQRKCHVLHKHVSNTEHSRYQTINKIIMLQILKPLCNTNAVLKDYVRAMQSESLHVSENYKE